jgi:hypothetical protein
MNRTLMQLVMRHLASVPCAALLLAGCTPGSGPSPAPGVITADTVPSVVVSPTEVRIVVPLGIVPAGPWRWNLATTPDNQLEYEWAVEVPARGGTYQLGYSTFKFKGSKAESGNLRGLVREGGVDVAFVRTENGQTVGVVTPIPLQVQVGQDRLVFLLRGRAAIEQVFALRPEQATMARVIATEQLPDRTVPIVYTPGN